MLTVVTTVSLKAGQEGVWDGVMRARVDAAANMPGWVAVQLLRGTEQPLSRAIVGTWQSREDWARWHDDEAFRQTRGRLADLEAEPGVTTWYEVVKADTES